jgi:hypothetical protein
MFGCHVPLTLDEYCKPVLGPSILNERNKDQVLIRYKRLNKLGNRNEETSLEEMVEGVPRSARLIAVHQAWLWKTAPFVITAFPAEHNVVDWISEYGWTGSDFQKIGVLLSHLIDFLDRPVMAGLSEPILNIFEKSIIALSNEVNEYIRSENIHDFSLDKERQYYHEIGDIREELSMIKSVLFQQEEMWKEFISNAWPDCWKDGRLSAPSNDDKETWRKIARPQVQFPKFNRRIAQLDEDAQRVEDSISIRLDLKAKHAGMRQTQASIREAHSTAVMSAAVFGFTIVTIIFTPLSFMLSLFALPIKRLQDHQIESRWTNDSGMYTTNYVGKWVGKSPGLSIETRRMLTRLATGELVSVFVTIVFMWAAIEFGLHDRITKRTWQWIKSTKLGQWVKSTKMWQAIKGLCQWIRKTRMWQWIEKMWQWTKSWFKPVETDSKTEPNTTPEKNGPANVTAAGTAQPKPADGSIQQPAGHRHSRRRSAQRDVEKGQLAH